MSSQCRHHSSAVKAKIIREGEETNYVGDQDNHSLLPSVHTLILYCTKFLSDKLPVTLALDYSHHVTSVEGGMGTQLMKRVC